MNAVGDDGIEEIDVNVRIYPNPTKGIVNIEVEGLKGIMVMNSLGQIVLETVDNQIDLSQFGSSIFILRIETETGVSIQKIVLKK